MNTVSTRLACRCGRVVLEVDGRPILSVECLCRDCRNAGAILQSLPGASSVLDQNGATRLVLHRKDRVRCLSGQDFLREHRLSKESKTRRVVAICCNTPVFLDFTQGHWLSLYGGRWPPASLPVLEIRTMTRDRPAGVELPDDAPNPATHTLLFYCKLLGAWAAMRFRIPKIDYVAGTLDVQ